MMFDTTYININNLFSVSSIHSYTRGGVGGKLRLSFSWRVCEKAKLP